MIDLNTHILSNPYDYQNNDEEINSKEDFLNKINNLLSSLIYSNSDIPNFNFMNDELKNKALSIKINNESNIDLSKIYFYSKKERFSKLLTIIKNVKLENSISENSTKESIQSLINELDKAVIEINELPQKAEYNTYGSIIKNFDDILNIVNNTEYIEMIEWIRSYPLSLISSILEEFSNTSDEDKSIVLNILMKKIYSIYKNIIYDMIQTKLFWIDFYNLIDIENDSFDVNTVSIDDNFIFDDILSDDDLDDLEFDDENKMGIEGIGPDSTFKRVGDTMSKVVNILKNIPGKVSKINKQFKLFRTKHKNHGFYMKYIGRIDGLYERYADEANIKENGMKDDPVKVLKEDAKDYIVDVSDKFTDLQIEILDIAKRFSTMSNPKEMLSYVNRYCGMYKSEIEKPADISNAMIRATRFKIATILLEHNKIYGYNAESIVENGKIPPANHTIVSLFVERPDEAPFDQKVSDIFKDASSFKLIAKNEKEPVFEATQVCHNLISKGIQQSDLKSIKKYKKENYRKVKSNINDYINDGEEKPGKAKKNFLAQTKQIWKGIQKSSEYMGKTKSYIADLVNGYFIMMFRIDNLCKECVTSMLMVERYRKDDKYKTGFKADNKNSNNQYKQKDEGEFKNKAMKEDERSEKYSEMRESMRSKIDEIKKAMIVRY